MNDKESQGNYVAGNRKREEKWKTRNKRIEKVGQMGRVSYLRMGGNDTEEVSRRVNGQQIIGINTVIYDECCRKRHFTNQDTQEIQQQYPTLAESLCVGYSER